MERQSIHLSEIINKFYKLGYWKKGIDPHNGSTYINSSNELWSIMMEVLTTIALHEKRIIMPEDLFWYMEYGYKKYGKRRAYTSRTDRYGQKLVEERNRERTLPQVIL